MNTKQFIAQIAPFAVIDMMRSKVLASITIAQGILESASGRSAPGHNLFGIKATGEEKQEGHSTKEFVNGQWVTIIAGFRCYDSWEGSINDHSQFLTENGRYARAGFFTACSKMDHKEAAQSLHYAGYATDPQYAESLIGLIEQFDLTQYDKEAVSNMQEIKDLQNKVTELEKRLEKTPAPDWFTEEFGTDEVALLKDATGDYDFWRNLAVTIRYFESKK